VRELQLMTQGPPPTTPAGRFRFRFSICSAISFEQVAGRSGLQMQL